MAEKPTPPPRPAPKLPPPSSIPHEVIEKGIGGGGRTRPPKR